MNRVAQANDKKSHSRLEINKHIYEISNSNYRKEIIQVVIKI